MRKTLIIVIGIVVILAGGAVFIALRAPKIYSNIISRHDTDSDTAADADEELPVPSSVPANPNDMAALPSDQTGLGNYDVLIADRGNNRLLVVTPNKQIIWEYHFDLPHAGLGADDAFFVNNGKSIIVNLEEYHVIELIDYTTKQVLWSYGTPGKPGAGPNELNTPDDAYHLPNGDIIVADIKNCRVIEISQDKQIVHQYGQTKQCDNKPGLLNKPNGDTPLPNGHILISNIIGHTLVELDQNWQPVFSMTLPASYPSDPQPTQAGNILLTDYLDPGKIIEVSRGGQIVWEYDGDPSIPLNRPSLAIELPNGNILANDDFNHRIIVIDKKTKHIVWQYGVTGKPGVGTGQLNVPDGLDIIPAGTLPQLTTMTIGQLTWHSAGYVGKEVSLVGYLRKQENGYAIFSDEVSGAISAHDLPVIGAGISYAKVGTKYILDGTFLGHGLTSINKNPNHLELLQPLEPAN